MTEQNAWDAVYRDLIAKGRERVGDPPSPETLVAYSRGELPENEAERVRESLAYYPDLAEALARKEQSREHSAPYLSKKQRDDDWRLLQQQLSVQHGPPPETSRRWQWLAAASVVVAIVCAGEWFQTWRDLRRPHTDLQRIEIFDDSARGPTPALQAVRVSPATHYVVLALMLAAQPDASQFRAEIVDLRPSPPRVIWSGALHRGRDGSFTIEVARTFLPPGPYKINLYQNNEREPVATYRISMSDG